MDFLSDIIEEHLSKNRSLNIYYQTEENKYQKKTLEEIVGVAKKIALMLRARFPPQSRILLIYYPGIDFLPSLLGCFYSGMIAVPTFPLTNMRHINRLQTIIRSCDPVLILGDKKVIELLNKSEEIKDVEKISTEQLWDAPYGNLIDLDIERKNQVAFLQYTSGSTGEAKGVIITHENLIHNLRSIEQCSLELLDNNKTAVTWLPYQHDLGLINGILYPLYKCAHIVILSPVAVIENPYRWLKAISDFKAYHTAGPNFSYQLCVDKISEEELSTLDLSSLDCAGLAAEPNRYQTMKEFVNKFRCCGFKEEAYCAAYGLAENTVHVTSDSNKTTPSYLFVSKDQLANGNIVLTEDDADKIALMSAGPINSCHEILIVNPEKRLICANDTVGEIWIHSQSTALGYWGKPEETEATFHATLVNNSKYYLKTGDLGFIHDNNLYITGRRKDLIIINGCNIYPQDIEYVVDSAHDYIKPDCTAVFSINRDGNEVIVVCAEIKRIHRNKDLREVTLKIRQAIAQSHHILIYDVKLLKPNQSFKTTSGKIQRKTTKDAYISGKLDCIEVPNDSIDLPVDKQLIANDLHKFLSEVLNIKQIEINQHFSDLGGTSIHAVLLQKKIQEYLGDSIHVSPTVVFEYPTLGELVSFVYHAKLGDSVQPVCGLDTKNEELTQPHESIAIVGIGCRLPGNINKLSELMSLLMEKRNVIQPIPEWRWDINEYDEELKHRIRYAGIIENMEWFEPEFFNISPKESYAMDPQQRMMLEVFWEALEDAAINPMRLKKKKIGIYIGCSNTDYHSLLIKNKHNTMSLHTILGNSLNVISGRMAYFLDSQGPTETIDTACSSSLVALHEACQSLRLGQTELALAGGVNLILYPENSIGLVNSNMLSPTHRCHAYSTLADGYVRSEGCGLVVLKRLHDAIQDNDTVYGVIKGSAINQNGASSGLTVPNLNAQVSLLQEALNNARLTPKDIDYIEGQGASTVLGDTIEIRAIKTVFENRKCQEPLYIGTVKSHIGHLESASGIMGLLKILASLNQSIMIGDSSIHEVNSQFELENGTIDILKNHRPWISSGGVRRAGISSFGFSGTNAHIIVEEPPLSIQKDSSITLPKKHLFVVSAKSLESFDHMIKSYMNYLEATDDAIQDICYTAAVGRFQFNYRFTCQISSKKELYKWLSQKKPVKVKINNEIKTSTVLNELEQYYLSGCEVDFNTYYKPYINALKKVKLPFYSFNRERYFIAPESQNNTFDAHQNGITDSHIAHKLEKIVRKVTLLDERKHLDVDKTFYALGIDSLMMLEMTRTVNQCFAIVPEMNVMDLLACGCPSQLCNEISKRLQNNNKQIGNNDISIKKSIVPRYKLRKINQQSLIIAHESQKRIVFLTELFPISYNIGLILKIHQTIDVDKLKNCIHEVIDSELIYKINFLKVDKELYQHVHFNRKIDVDVIYDKHDVVNQMKQKIYEPYDLYHSSLIRISLAVNHSESHILIACHHSISDLISCSMFIKKIFELYFKEIPPSIASKNYFDYSAHCHHLFNSKEYLSIEDYWLSKYENINLISTIDSDKESRSTGQMIQSFVKDASALYKSIDAFSKEQSVSIFSILLSSFLIFINKRNNYPYATVGVTNHGRWSEEIASSQGFFTQTLPFVIKLNQDETLISLINQVTNQLQADSYYQPLDLSQLSKKLQSKQIKKPFEIIFNYDSSNFTEGFDNLEVIYLENASTNYDISFSWHKTNNNLLQLSIKYNSVVFSEHYIQVLSNQYLHVINQLLLNPLLFVSQLTLSNEEEMQFMLSHLTGTKNEEYTQKSIVEAIQNTISHHPNHLAVITENEKLTYAEFSKKANKITGFLKKKNIKKGSVVGLYFVNDPNLIIAMYAVLQAQAAFVLLNPELPEERLNYIINDSSTALIISNLHIFDDLQNKNQYVLEDIYRDSAMTVLHNYCTDLNDLAYICYTSGTTGKPKGVKISHLGLINLSMNYRDLFALSSKVRSGQYSSINFDAYVGEIFPALVSASTIVCIPNEIKTDVEKLLAFIDEYTINHLFLPTAIYHRLPEICLKSLKTLIVAGERLRRYKLQNYRVFNAYGPTENTVCTAIKELKNDNKITIGHPISNVHTLIVDEFNKLCPVGIAGELLIGGKSLSMGYIHPENTNNAFVQNPLNSKEKLYKTGDICRLLPKGDIQYIGRNDSQIKIRGVRLELGEIESTIISHESISVAFVAVESCGEDDLRLVGYIVPNPSCKYYEKEHEAQADWFRTLIAFQAQYLPNQAIVRYFIVLNELPININGKVDKTKLPKPNFEDFSLSEYVQPSTDFQIKITEIWSKILDKKTIGINDNFFDLGGQSLTVIPLINAIEEEIGIRFSAKEIYQYPTIDQLTAAINKTKTINQTENLETIDYDKEVQMEFISDHLKWYHIKPNKKNLILLTGANGYIGSYLLASLIKKETNPIYCLIRAEDEHEGFNRIKSSLVQKGLWMDDFQNKFIPILGNLASPDLGINENDYNLISEEVHHIIHSGTLMNHLMDYSQLKSVNVNGLKELMKFACKGQSKLIHFISTMNVFGINPYHLTYNEHTELSKEFHLGKYGYAASKWIADSLCQLARKSGIHCNVFRLGLVLPSVCEKEIPEHQWFLDCLIACIIMSSYPDILETIKLPVITVDSAVRGILGLIARSDANTDTYHLWEPQLFQPKEILNELKKVIPLKKMHLTDWIKEYDLIANLLLIPPIELLKSETYTKQADMAINEHWLIKNLTSDYLSRYQNNYTHQSCAQMQIELENITTNYISHLVMKLIRRAEKLA